MGRKRKANRIESSSAKKTGRKTRRRAAKDATGAEDTGGAKKTAGDEKTAGNEKAAGEKETAGDKKKAGTETTGVNTTRQNRAVVRKAAAEADQDEEANPDGDGEETGVGGEVEKGVAKEASSDEVKSGEEAEAESGDKVVEEDKSEENHAAAASYSKGKGITKEDKANKSRMDIVFKHCIAPAAEDRRETEEWETAIQREMAPQTGGSTGIVGCTLARAGNYKGDPKQARHGTATAVVIGDDVAYAVAEGRVLEFEGVKKWISSGVEQKLVLLSNTIFAIVAGKCELLGSMFHQVVDVLERDANDIVGAHNACKNFSNEWKAQPDNLGKHFGCSITWVGWTDEGMFIGVSGRHNKVIREKGILATSGDGSMWTEGVSRFRLEDNTFSTDEEYIDCLAGGISCTCIHTPSCGGMLSYASVRRGEKVKIRRLFHVVKALSIFYDDLRQYMKTCYLLVSKGILYSHEEEQRLQEYYGTELKGLRTMHVLGVRKSSKIIVRVLVFFNKSARKAALPMLRELVGKSTGCKLHRFSRKNIRRLRDQFEACEHNIEKVDEHSADFL